MNKLEEQIDKKSSDWVSDHQHERAFEEGAQFVIDLELMEKFAEWLSDSMWQFNGDTWVNYYNPDIASEHKTTKELRKVWIENIYGK